MKCPNCGAENSDTSQHCQTCAMRLESTVETPRRLNVDVRKAVRVISALLVAMILVSLSLYTIYVDPRSSWSSSIRDHDGDGVPDSSDPRPYDSSIWAYGSATVILAGHNNYNRSVDFSWRLLLVGNETDVRWSCSIPSNGTLGRAVNVSWLEGENHSQWYCDVWWLVDGVGLSTTLTFGTFEISDGQSLTFMATFPDDFPPPLP